jgi:acetylornithine deacetylase/succinyl-diaminopimelate desuccinylase-like protein
LEAIRRLKAAKYEPKRTIHCLFVPDEEIGGVRGMKKFVTLDEFKALNVGFVLDEGKRNKVKFKTSKFSFFVYRSSQRNRCLSSLLW